MRRPPAPRSVGPQVRWLAVRWKGSGAGGVDAETAEERLGQVAERFPHLDSGTAELAPDLEALAGYQGAAAEASRDMDLDLPEDDGPGDPDDAEAGEADAHLSA